MKTKHIIFCFSVLTLMTSAVFADSKKVIFSNNNHYYQRFDTPTTWNKAVASCRGLGRDAHLATVSTPEENRFVMAFADKYQGSWLGGTLTRTGDVLWVNGDTAMVNNDDKSSKIGDHFLMTTAGSWKRNIDAQPLSYICEWDSLL